MSSIIVSPLRRLGLGAGLALLCVAAVAPGGGFQLAVDFPEAAEARSSQAVLHIRTFGCHQPTAARLEGTAEGLVKGQRRSIPLQIQATDEGVYVVDRQWPAEGTWVLAITGTYRGMTSSALVALGSGGVLQRPEPAGRSAKKPEVRILSEKLTADVIEQTLQRAARSEQPAASRS